MKKILIAAALSAAVFMSGCFDSIETGEDVLSEESVAEKIQTAAEIMMTETAAEETTAPVTEAVTTTTTEVTEQETVPTEPVTLADEMSCEAFLSIFEGADPSAGFIGNSMKEAVGALKEEISVKKLTKENISETRHEEAADNTLFAFSIARSSGIVPVKIEKTTYYATSFTTAEDEEFTAVFGNNKNNSYEEAAAYINTCGRVDYLGFCTRSGGRTIIIPVAAGNSRDGIYAVLPNLGMMGYDVSRAETFGGMSDSLDLYITKAETDEGRRMVTLHYVIRDTFSEDVSIECDGFYMNGEPLPDGYRNNFPLRMAGKGSIEIKSPAISRGDICYFTGRVVSSKSGEVLSEFGMTAYNLLKD